MGAVRAFFGLGPSRQERIAQLQERLARETRELDFMAYRHPKTYREISATGEIGYIFRPGVAVLEMREATRSLKQGRP